MAVNRPRRQRSRSSQRDRQPKRRHQQVRRHHCSACCYRIRHHHRIWRGRQTPCQLLWRRRFGQKTTEGPNRHHRRWPRPRRDRSNQAATIRHPKEAVRHHHESRAWQNERQGRSAACSFPGLPSKTPPSHRDAAHEEPQRRSASHWRQIERRPKRQPSHRDEPKKEPYGEAPCRHRRHASTRPSRPGQRQRTKRFESHHRTKRPRAREPEEPTLLQSELRTLILPAASLSPLS